jgi:urea transport system permease protein
MWAGSGPAIVDSFMVVVLGGVNWPARLTRPAWRAEQLLEGWQGAVLAKITVLVFIVMFIQKRPQGIFAQRAER